MAVVISDELQELFDLRDHLAEANKKLGHAEAEYKSNLQLNSDKEFIEVHDLEVLHKLLKSTSDAKHEMDVINLKFEEKKHFFVTLMEASGCPKLLCNNKEWHHDGTFEYVPYMFSIVEDNDGEPELLMEAKH